MSTVNAEMSTELSNLWTIWLAGKEPYRLPLLAALICRHSVKWRSPGVVYSSHVVLSQK